MKNSQQCVVCTKGVSFKSCIICVVLSWIERFFVGTYAYAQKIANEIKRYGEDIHKMKIASSENDHGICSMISKAAEMLGMEVIWDTFSNSKLSRNRMEEVEDYRDSIDCLVCSAGLHPGEINVLARNLKQGKILQSLSITRIFTAILGSPQNLIACLIYCYLRAAKLGVRSIPSYNAIKYARKVFFNVKRKPKILILSILYIRLNVLFEFINAKIFMENQYSNP